MADQTRPDTMRTRLWGGPQDGLDQYVELDPRNGGFRELIVPAPTLAGQVTGPDSRYTWNVGSSRMQYRGPA